MGKAYIETYAPDGEYNFKTNQCVKCRQHFCEDDVHGNHKGYYCPECLNEYLSNATLRKLFIALDTTDSFDDGDVDEIEYCELNIEAFAEFLNDLRTGKYNNMMIKIERTA